MKKILFVTESLCRGGMERMQVTIANALASRGYDVTLICYDSRDELIPDLLPQIHYKYVPRKEFPILTKIPHIQRRYNYRKFAWEHNSTAATLYKYYVGNEKFDVEVGFYRGPAIKIISGSPNKASKKLAWVHTDFTLCDPRTIVGWFNNLEEAKEAYAKFDDICCVSSQAKDSFEQVIGCKGKTSTVYNMIPTSKILEMSKEPCPVEHKKFTIVSVGRLIPDKCIDRLLEADKQLLSEGFDFDLWIVGSGRVDDELKAYCEENNLANVTFAGMQKNPYSWMKAADLFVLSSRREGFAIVIPEAMACGLPVVSTRCTGPTEILNDGEFGILVENSADGVYEGLKSALSDRTMLAKYKELSAVRAPYFDENRIIQQITEKFE